MALAGYHTAAMNQWLVHEVLDDFVDGDPVTSGFVLSGVANFGSWQTVPNSANNQTSGVTFVSNSGGLGGTATLNVPNVTGANGGAFTKREMFAFQSGGTLYGRASVRLDEITSGAMQAFIGFASAPFQSGLVGAGALRTSGNMVGFAKFSGSTVWSLAGNVQGSGASVLINNGPQAGAASSGKFQDLQLFVNSDRQNMQITAQINGIPCKNQPTDVFPIVLKFPADGTAMAFGTSITEGAAEASAVTLDKVLANQTTNYPT